MAKAKFLRTIENTPKAKAIVQVESQEVIVEFWPELATQWGKDATKLYLCAEALWQTGFYADAKALLTKGASGSIGEGEDGKPVDTRNWQQNWLDAHIIPVATVDPLA